MMKRSPKRIFGITASWFRTRVVLIVAALVLVVSAANGTSAMVVGGSGAFGKAASSNGRRFLFQPLLLAIKLFELDTSVREAARQLGLAYNTAYRLHHLLRTAILSTAEDAASLKGEIELDEAYFGGRKKGKRGRSAAGKVPVFDILERGGKVRVEVVQGGKERHSSNSPSRK